MSAATQAVRKAIDRSSAHLDPVFWRYAGDIIANYDASVFIPFVSYDLSCKGTVRCDAITACMP